MLSYSRIERASTFPPLLPERRTTFEVVLLEEYSLTSKSPGRFLNIHQPTYCVMIGMNDKSTAIEVRLEVFSTCDNS